MNIQRGQRGKLEDYYHLDFPLEIRMQTIGTAIYDYCCFDVDGTNNLSDDWYMIFYNQPFSPQKELSYQISGNYALFQANLNHLPETIYKLVFTISIDGAGSMGQFSNFEISINQNGCDTILLRLNGNDFSQEKAIIAFELYRKNGWRYVAIARGFNGGLRELLRAYGGEEIENSQQIQSAEPSIFESVSQQIFSPPSQGKTEFFCIDSDLKIQNITRLLKDLEITEPIIVTGINDELAKNIF